MYIFIWLTYTASSQNKEGRSVPSRFRSWRSDETVINLFGNLFKLLSHILFRTYFVSPYEVSDQRIPVHILDRRKSLKVRVVNDNRMTSIIAHLSGCDQFYWRKLRREVSIGAAVCYPYHLYSSHRYSILRGSILGEPFWKYSPN